MKKTLSALTAFLMTIALFGMTACQGGKNGDGDTTASSPDTSAADVSQTQTEPSFQEPVTLEPGDEYVGGWETFTLTADKTTVAPGDTVTVTFHAENCKNVACFDVLFTASEALTDAAGKEKDPGEFITTVNYPSGAVQFSAIVATTSTIEAQDLLTLTYTVSPDAVPGDKLTVQGEFTQYLVGTDESGDQVADAGSLVSVEPLTLTVG